MSQELRHRSTAASGSQNTSDTERLLMRGSGAGLSAKVLLDASPTQEGIALKLHVPAFYPFIPTCLQRILTSGWLRNLNVAPHWTERHLVLVGKYLYRFTDRSSATPKGAPVPLEAVDARGIDNEEDLDGMEFVLQQLPPGCNAVFAVSTFGKTQYFAVATVEECATWVNSLREARQAAITRSMGHAAQLPYPKSWEYFDTLGTSLLRSKERIKKRMQESSVKEMEMSSFGDAAGALPRGYYG